MYKLKGQFYTKPKVAAHCYKIFQKVAKNIKVDLDDYTFIEPSAGCGCFSQLLPENRKIGIDIEPRNLPGIKGEGIIKSDYLKWYPEDKSKKYIVIGNPPFGKRSKVAVDFFNHSAAITNIIAFIVPRQFQKYSVHSKLNKNFKLIKDYELDENSFFTPDGKDFKIRCVFQIWTSNNIKHRNLRILTPPPITHPDFKMFQYNNTSKALKVFDEDWDFAVPRQGYENYKRRELDSRKCERNKQWIMFKVKNRQIFKRLWDFDFESLARKNTTIYGFGKADVVMEYNHLYAESTI